MPQSLGPFVVRVPRLAKQAPLTAQDVNTALGGLEQQVNLHLQRIVAALDDRMGFRGPVQVHDALNLKGNTIQDVGTVDASSTAHATSVPQAGKTLAVGSDGVSWDAKSHTLSNVADGVQPTDAATVRQLGSTADTITALSTQTPTTVNAGDTGTIGADARAAHGQHRHGVTTATAGAITQIQAGDSAAAGTATSLVRGDHQHGVATGVVGDIHAIGPAAAGTSPHLARADHVHPVSVVATASLPAAGAGMDGTILLEDAGGGVINLIIYGAGIRARCAGVAF
jgi:hypothetical protein